MSTGEGGEAWKTRSGSSVIAMSGRGSVGGVACRLSVRRVWALSWLPFPVMKNGDSAKERAVSENSPRSMNVPGKTAHASSAVRAQITDLRMRRGMGWERLKWNPAP